MISNYVLVMRLTSWDFVFNVDSNDYSSKKMNNDYFSPPPASVGASNMISVVEYGVKHLKLKESKV